jgi:F-type H+-transporting ATPase subunit delta
MNSLADEKHAEALFELAQAEGKVADYETALQNVLHDFAMNPALESCLSSYALPKEDIYHLIDEIYGKIPLKSLTSFLKVVVNHHRMDHFKDIEAAYRRLANAELGIKEGLVYSAMPLSKEEMTLLQKTLENKLQVKLELENRTEPSLLGGVRVAIDGKVYDGTLNTKLEALRSRLLAEGEKQ